ncbi:DUF4052 family protein [Bacillus cereus]
MIALETKDVTKKYKKKIAVNEVTISLEEHKIYGLLGRNGAGKTTLLNLLAGQITSSSGSISIFGEHVFENSKAMQNICFVKVKEAAYLNFVQFIFYSTLACLFQSTTIVQKRFNWFGLAFSIIVLFGLASTMYAGIGIKELVFINSKMLLEIPNFILVSIVLICIYIVISALFIRKVSFEDTI